MTFTSGDSATPMATLLNQAVTEGKAYTDTQLAVIDWTVFTPTVAAGWTAGSCRYRQFGPIREIRLEATYSGATLTANSVGDIPNTDLFTGAGFPAGILPSQNLYLHGTRYRGSGGDLSYGIYLSASGRTVITDTHPTSTLASGDIVFLTATYMVG